MKHLKYAIVLSAALASAPGQAGERQERAKEAALTFAQCVYSKARQFATQAEPAETIATAAIGLCYNEKVSLIKLLKESTREYGLPFTSTANDTTIMNGYNQIESLVKTNAVAAVLEARAK